MDFKFSSDIPTQIAEIPAGSNAVLRCNSNDDQHNFFFWQYGDNNLIGPTNENQYDHTKFKYNVLSGKLQIKHVTPTEAGFYKCFSKHIDKEDLKVGAVKMVVNGGTNEKLIALPTPVEPGDSLEVVKIVLIIISLIVMITCAIIFYRMKKAEKTRNARLVMLAEDEEEEGSGDEIYNRTTTIINDSVAGPSNTSSSSTPHGHITGIDNQGLDTDFNAAFEQISINMANRNINLI